MKMFSEIQKPGQNFEIELWHIFKHDRNDIYAFTELEEDPRKMIYILNYEIKEVNCNPDFDW